MISDPLSTLQGWAHRLGIIGYYIEEKDKGEIETYPKIAHQLKNLMDKMVMTIAAKIFFK